MNQSEHPKLIHIAEYSPQGKGRCRLLLRREKNGTYQWFVEDKQKEIPTEISGATVEEALRAAKQRWKLSAFRPLICGFRYTLPERDEHGMNALFHQLAASQRSFNGVYFDEELGHSCFVQNAPTETLALLKQLEASNRL